MSIFIPAATFATTTIFWRRKLGGWRDGLLASAISCGAFLIVATELLSIANWITRAGIIQAWCVALLISVAVLLRYGRSKAAGLPQTADDRFGAWALAAQIVVIAAILKWVAEYGPPNNWDSMTYHMSRVLHWVQNRNVAFYPTYILRQLEMPPGAEYILLHLQLLAGSDQYATSLQWMAYVGCAIGASSVAELLGAGRAGQIAAAVVAATLPMACLEAVSTQNDLVDAFWLTCFLWITLKIWKSDSADRPLGRMQFGLAGAALGLALVTKTTSHLFAAPIGLILTGVALRNWKARAVPAIAAVLLIALAMNLPTYVRNERFTGSPLGAGGFGKVTVSPYDNTHVNFKNTVSNLIRNAGLEIAYEPLGICHASERAIRKVLTVMHIDPDDPGTTVDAPYCLTNLMWNQEDNAPDPVHFVLALLAFVTLAVTLRKAPKMAAICALAIAVAGTAFCALLRVQPFHSRLHLPLFMLAAPIVGVVMERYWRARVSGIVCGLLVLTTVPLIATNFNHPILGPRSILNVYYREQRMFQLRPHLFRTYQAVSDFAAARHCVQVGLVMTGDDWEYPMLTNLQYRIAGVRVEAYPTGYLIGAAELHTHNLGWDENLRPYLVVGIKGDSVTLVKMCDQFGNMTTPPMPPIPED